MHQINRLLEELLELHSHAYSVLYFAAHLDTDLPEPQVHALLGVLRYTLIESCKLLERADNDLVRLLEVAPHPDAKEGQEPDAEPTDPAA